MPWAIIASILGGLPGAIGDYFKTKGQIELKTLENQLAMKQEENKLIAQGIIAQTELGQEQLRSTSAWFKQTFYGILLAPIIITCVSPEHGKAIFDALNIVPQWYIIFVTTIGFAVWGISSDKVAAVVAARREYKLEKMRIKIDRKAFYAAMRETKGFVTPEDVKESEAVFDKLDAGA